MSFLKNTVPDVDDTCCFLTVSCTSPIGHGLEKEASKARLKMKTKKIKIIGLTVHKNLSICINCQNIEDGTEFINVDILVFTDLET